MSQLALPATMIPQVVWAEALQQASHWNPEGTTGTASFLGTILAPGLACFPLITSTQPILFWLLEQAVKATNLIGWKRKAYGIWVWRTTVRDTFGQ